jgi:hypothetical protein
MEKPDVQLQRLCRVAARLSVAEQMSTFLPFRGGTLIRFIREGR